MKVGKRILILEDDPKSRYALKAVLEADGHQIFAFENAEEARSLNGDHLDIAIIDVRLPYQFGTDFAKSLEAARHGHIKVVFVTAYDDLEKIHSGVAGSVLLVKPIDMEVLKKLL